jgi:hypothetical protein
MRRLAQCFALCTVLAGCNASSPVIPDKTIYLTNSISFSAADALMVAAVVGVAYLVIDPLAPNWDIHETKLSDTRYRIDLRKKRITTGGDGESIELFHRQAEVIAAATKASGYTILSWNEGVDSDFPIARRWSRGEIELKAPAALN